MSGFIRFRAQSLGFRVHGQVSGTIRILDLGLRVDQVSGFKDQDSGISRVYKSYGLGLIVSGIGLGFRGQGLGFKIEVLVFGVRGQIFGIRAYPDHDRVQDLQF